MIEAPTLVCGKKQIKSTKALLKLYRKVLHSVNNELVYLDDEVYVNSRKHLSELVNSFVPFETQAEENNFEERVTGYHKSLSLLEIIDQTAVVMRDYPDNGRTYYEILSRYYFDHFSYTHSELCDILEMSRSNYFRYFDQAIACFYIHFIPILKSKDYSFNEDLLAPDLV